ncbi:hypothetical protein GGR52DRAFT_591986 [Hypoxylon sp. FL1284]|nr:hypothetical protein GGR52DRAFT_591986 [Hypoxylon sp. FL1284]
MAKANNITCLASERDAQSNLSAVPAPKDAQWAWRVNISEFSVPNVEGAEPAVDPHLVSTTYDFTWPGSGNLSAALGATRDVGVCVSFVEAPADWPVNVTNAYTEDDTSDTSCVGALGQACVDAILAEVLGPGSSSQRCQVRGASWFNLPACDGGGVASWGLGFSKYDIATSANGASWFSRLSAPQNGSGSAAYYTAANRLHVVMANPVFAGDGADQGGSSFGPELLCMRVNATKLPTGDANGNNVTWTSQAVLEAAPESIASSVKLGSVSILFAVTFASFFL